MSEIREARERMPIDSPFDPFTLLRCFGEEVLELRAHIDLISQKLVASESLYKSYKEDSKRMYSNSCKSYQEKIDNLEKKIHELESPAKHEAGQRCNHYKCEKCFNQSPQIISKESWDNACNGLGGNRG